MMNRVYFIRKTKNTRKKKKREIIGRSTSIEESSTTAKTVKQGVPTPSPGLPGKVTFTKPRYGEQEGIPSKGLITQTRKEG